MNGVTVQGTTMAACVLISSGGCSADNAVNCLEDDRLNSHRLKSRRDFLRLKVA
jgi:hypothetical protein